MTDSFSLAQTTHAHPRRLNGTVISDRMQKTVVVAVSRTRLHKKVKKYYTITTKFKAHDPERSAHVGDVVVIEETRPRSKDKHWRLVEKLREAKKVSAEE